MIGRSRRNGLERRLRLRAPRRRRSTTLPAAAACPAPPSVHSSANEPKLLRMKSRRDQASAGGRKGVGRITAPRTRTTARRVAERLPTCVARLELDGVAAAAPSFALRTVTVRVPARTCTPHRAQHPPDLARA